MKKIKLGQLGIGHNHGEGKMIAAHHFPELFEIVGVCEPDEGWIKARGSLECYKGIPFISEEELFEKCDAILVETTVPDLNKAAKKCIDAGKHIHMDKPAGENYAEYKEMLKLAEEKNLVVQLGYMYRNNPAVLKTLELMKEGRIGDITSINIEMSTDHPDEYRKWLSQYTGGSMYIFGSHLIDLAMLIMGKEPENVYRYNKKTNKNGVEAYDNCFALLDFGSALAKITNNSTEINGWSRRQLVVCGTKGTVEIKPLELPTIMTFAEKENCKNAYATMTQPIDITSVPNDRRYDTMMKDFYEYITGAKENPYTYDYELALHRTILKASGVKI